MALTSRALTTPSRLYYPRLPNTELTVQTPSLTSVCARPHPLPANHTPALMNKRYLSVRRLLIGWQGSSVSNVYGLLLMVLLCERQNS